MPDNPGNAAPPCLTAQTPGTGGAIRVLEEDFEVEEIPLYEACGAGEHLYLTVRKKGVSTHAVISELAGKLGKRPADVGYAGLKDARSVALQRLSVEHVSEEKVRDIRLHGAEVVKVERHGNKLKPGHLAGNRFRIVIRGARPGTRSTAQEVLDVLAGRGVPNWFGEQRFGKYASNHLAGKALIAGDAAAFAAAIMTPPGWEEVSDESRAAREAFAAGRYASAAELLPRFMRGEARIVAELARSGSSERALRALNPRLAFFYMSAWQSHVFNRVLVKRGVERMDELMAGDLAYIHAKGAVFEVKDAQAEAARAKAFEISPSGPLWGSKSPVAGGTAGEMEREALAEEGLGTAVWDSRRVKRLTGGRRPFRVPILLHTPAEEPEPGTLVLRFSLPAGAYATNVLREVTKSTPGGVDE